MTLPGVNSGSAPASLQRRHGAGYSPSQETALWGGNGLHARRAWVWREAGRGPALGLQPGASGQGQPTTPQVLGLQRGMA